MISLTTTLIRFVQYRRPIPSIRAIRPSLAIRRIIVPDDQESRQRFVPLARSYVGASPTLSIHSSLAIYNCGQTFHAFCVPMDRTCGIKRVSTRFLRIVSVFCSEKGLRKARAPPDRRPQVVSSVTFEGSSTCIGIFCRSLSPRVFAVLSDRKRRNTSDGMGRDHMKTQNHLVFRCRFTPPEVSRTRCSEV